MGNEEEGVKLLVRGSRQRRKYSEIRRSELNIPVKTDEEDKMEVMAKKEDKE